MTEIGPDQSGRLIIATDVGGTVLKQYIAEDAPLVRGLVLKNVKHFTSVHEAMPKNVATPEKAVAWVTGRSSSEDIVQDARLGIWVDDTMVGGSGFLLRKDRTAELWYFVGAEHIRHHYASIATIALKSYLFRNGIIGAQLFIDPENGASLRTAELSGFSKVEQFEGRERYVAYNPHFFGHGPISTF